MIEVIANAIEIPKQAQNILKYNLGETSLKAPFAIYLDLECLLKKEQSHDNNNNNNNLEKHEEICNNCDSCRIEMPKWVEKILKYSPGKKSLKAPYAIYFDLEFLLKKYKIFSKHLKKILHRQKS